MFIRKKGTDIELYDNGLKLIKIFRDAEYRKEGGKIIIHTNTDRYSLLCEMPELMTSILYTSDDEHNNDNNNNK